MKTIITFYYDVNERSFSALFYEEGIHYKDFPKEIVSSANFRKTLIDSCGFKSLGIVDVFRSTFLR